MEAVLNGTAIPDMALCSSGQLFMRTDHEMLRTVAIGMGLSLNSFGIPINEPTIDGEEPEPEKGPEPEPRAQSKNQGQSQ
jgi:hypothetical protein